MAGPVGRSGQPGWIVRSPGDLGSVAPGPVSKNCSQPLHQPLRISKVWREEVWVRGGIHYGGEWSSRGVQYTFWGPLRLQGQLVLVDLEN